MTEFYIGRKNNKHFFILRLENEYIDHIVRAMKIILHIEKAEVISSALRTFARSIPLHTYVMFSASVEHDILSLLTHGGCMFGFVPDGYGEEGFLCLDGIKTWKTNNERKNSCDLMIYFKLEEVIKVENLEDVNASPQHLVGIRSVPIVMA